MTSTIIISKGPLSCFKCTWAPLATGIKGAMVPRVIVLTSRLVALFSVFGRLYLDRTEQPLGDVHVLLGSVLSMLS